MDLFLALYDFILHIRIAKFPVTDSTDPYAYFCNPFSAYLLLWEFCLPYLPIFLSVIDHFQMIYASLMAHLPIVYSGKCLQAEFQGDYKSPLFLYHSLWITVYPCPLANVSYTQPLFHLFRVKKLSLVPVTLTWPELGVPNFIDVGCVYVCVCVYLI